MSDKASSRRATTAGLTAEQAQTARTLLQLHVQSELIESTAPTVRPAPDLSARVLDQARRQDGRRRRGLLTGGAGVVLVGALAAATFSGGADFEQHYQPSAVMSPSVPAGSIVLLTHKAEVLHGDVVRVVLRPAGAEPFVTLSRVVGLPGDALACPDSGAGSCEALLRNGEPVDEPWASRGGLPFHETRVREGHVFVLGDRRDQAVDSSQLGSARLADVDGVLVGVLDKDRQLVRVPGTPKRIPPRDGETVDGPGPIPSSDVPPGT